MTFSFWRKREDIAFILDIGSASVGGALVQYRKNDTPLVLRAFRENISFQDKLRHGRFLSLTFNAIESVCRRFEQDPRSGRVQEIQCFLAAPWCDSEMARIQIKKKELFPALPDTLHEAVGREAEAFVLARLREYDEQSQPVVIGADSMKVRIRGYDITELHGQMVDEMSAHAYITTMPQDIKRTMEERIGRYFPSRKIEFHSFMFAMFDFLRKIVPAEETYAALDITGEVTSILLVREGETQKEVTVPFGRHVLIRHLAKKLSTTPHEAEALFSLYESGAAARAVGKKIERALEESRSEFLEHVTEGFHKIRRSPTIPKKIFFSADADFAPWFKKGLETFSAKARGDAERAEAVYLGQVLLGRSCAFAPETPRDPFLALGAIYIENQRKSS